MCQKVKCMRMGTNSKGRDTPSQQPRPSKPIPGPSHSTIPKDTHSARLTLSSNSLQKEVILALGHLFRSSIVFSSNHSTTFWNLLVKFGTSWEGVSRGSFGVNVMISFLILVNGLWRRRTTWCGIPFLITVELGGNGLLSVTWEKL